MTSLGVVRKNAGWFYKLYIINSHIRWWINTSKLSVHSRCWWATQRNLQMQTNSPFSYTASINRIAWFASVGPSNASFHWIGSHLKKTPTHSPTEIIETMPFWRWRQQKNRTSLKSFSINSTLQFHTVQCWTWMTLMNKTSKTMTSICNNTSKSLKNWINLLY